MIVGDVKAVVWYYRRILAGLLEDCLVDARLGRKVCCLARVIKGPVWLFSARMFHDCEEMRFL